MPTPYDKFKNWPYWKGLTEVCRGLVNKGRTVVSGRTVRAWKKKAEALRLQAAELEKKANSRCPHSLEYQTHISVCVGGDEWHDDCADRITCDLCGRILWTGNKDKL
jgi:hypothetical protein